MIERYEFPDGRARHKSTPAVHPDHLIDVTTGRVVEFHSREIERLQARVAGKLGHRVVGHRLELYAKPVARERYQR